MYVHTDFEEKIYSRTFACDTFVYMRISTCRHDMKYTLNQNDKYIQISTYRYLRTHVYALVYTCVYYIYIYRDPIDVIGTLAYAP